MCCWGDVLLGFSSLGSFGKDFLAHQGINNAGTTTSRPWALRFAPRVPAMRQELAALRRQGRGLGWAKRARRAKRTSGSRQAQVPAAVLEVCEVRMRGRRTWPSLSMPVRSDSLSLLSTHSGQVSPRPTLAPPFLPPAFLKCKPSADSRRTHVLASAPARKRSLCLWSVLRLESVISAALYSATGK
jgi:hypothetical protein